MPLQPITKAMWLRAKRIKADRVMVLGAIFLGKNWMSQSPKGLHRY